MEREQLRRRIIIGVILTAIACPVQLFLINRNVNSNHIFGLIFTVILMIVLLVYAHRLKASSDGKR